MIEGKDRKEKKEIGNRIIKGGLSGGIFKA